MKKSWIEMVQDYVDARMAVGGCLLGVIVTGVIVWAFIDTIKGIVESWSDIWPVWIIFFSIGWLGIGMGLVVSRSSYEKFHRNTALVLVLPVLVHLVGAILVFAMDVEWFFGIALIVMEIAYLIALWAQIYLHKQQQ